MTAAEDSHRWSRGMSLVDHFGGDTRAVSFAGEHLLIGVGFRVLSLRLDRKGGPAIAGQSPPLSGMVHRIVVDGTRVYVNAGYALDILDLDGRGHLQRLGGIPQEYAPEQYFDYGLGLAVVDDHLFVVDELSYGEGLLVFNMCDPRAPRFLGNHPTADPDTKRAPRQMLGLIELAVAGTLGVAAAHSGLAVLDLADPRRPALLGHCSVGEDGRCVAVREGVAYLGTEAGLHRIDLSDPAHPRPSGFFGAPGITQIALEGDTAYAVSWDRHLYAIDLAHPDLLAAVSHAAGLYSAMDIVVRGGRAYVADGEGGLSVVDVTDRTRPRFLGYDITVPEVTDVAIAGQHALVVDGRGYLGSNAIWVAKGHFLDGKAGGLRSVDLSAKPARRLLRWTQLTGRGRSIAVADGSALVLSHDGVCLFDVSDPARPKRLAGIPGLEAPDRVLRVGNRLYAARDDRLTVFALSAKHDARELGRYHAGQPIADLAVSGGYAYLATHDGLEVVSVAKQPELAGKYVTQEAVECLAVAGSRAYLMVEHDLHVVDVADPANPHLLGKVETGCCGWFHSVMVEGNKAYVVAWDEVSVVDVADASHPREIASHHLDDREDEPTGAALSEGRLYVACGNNGLLVFALDEDTSQATLGL